MVMPIKLVQKQCMNSDGNCGHANALSISFSRPRGGTRKPKTETRTLKTENRNPNTQTRTPKTEHPNPKTENRNPNIVCFAKKSRMSWCKLTKSSLKCLYGGFRAHVLFNGTRKPNTYTAKSVLSARICQDCCMVFPTISLRPIAATRSNPP